MSDARSGMPAANHAGLVPTLNRKGFMNESLNAVSRAFVEFASTSRDQLLDIGCAYGVATLPALAAGAYVTASDMEQGHLDVLETRVPESDRARLTLAVGTLPQIDFLPETFGAVHCSRLLHFLLPEEARLCFVKFHEWLLPGGWLFLVSDTPYAGYWSTTAPDYIKRKETGDEWPGFIADTRPLLSGESLKAKGDGPFHLNPVDPDILEREAGRAGFCVQEARFLPSVSRAGGNRDTGRNQAGLIATKS